jgi:imidazolonepropionase-like amidohydrolase
MSKNDVIKSMTYNAAKINKIDDLLGTLEKGKLASFVMWNGDPFSLESRVVGVVMEGRYKEIKE